MFVYINNKAYICMYIQTLWEWLQDMIVIKQ